MMRFKNKVRKAREREMNKILDRPVDQSTLKLSLKFIVLSVTFLDMILVINFA